MNKFFSTISNNLSNRERSTLMVCVTVVIVGVIWGTALFIKEKTTLIPKEGGTYREGAVGQPRYISPVLARTNDVDMNISRLVYSGLMRVDENKKVIGDLAEKIDISADGKIYTARLRSNIKWHDGEQFNADDVLFTIQTIQNPESKSPAAPIFQGVTVEKIDDQTITFSLQEPYAPFLYNLTQSIMPEHVWESVEPKNISLAEQNLKPIGTGPFMFKKLKKNTMGEVRDYELTRFDGYFGQRPYINEIIFSFYQSNEELLRAFQGNKIDGMSFVPPTLVAEINRIRSAKVYRAKLPQYFAVFFNQARQPVLADQTIRTALDLAIDRDKIIREALYNEGTRIDTPIPPGFLGYQEGLGRVEYNPNKANQNLDEAGWKVNEKTGIREKDGKPFTFTLTTTDWTEYTKTADLLAEQWRAIGADVKLEAQTVGTVQSEAIRPRAYDAILYGEVLGADPDPYPFWHSTQTRDPGLNLALYKDTESDKLLEQARKTTDIAKREETYKKFQERLIGAVPALFLYSPTYDYALHNNVHGQMLDAIQLPAQRFNTISTWYVKTKRIWKK
jgi:peptide/nickel transport system substrate-binding protein